MVTYNSSETSTYSSKLFMGHNQFAQEQKREDLYEMLYMEKTHRSLFEVVSTRKRKIKWI
jgi:hypothetical protein